MSAALGNGFCGRHVRITNPQTGRTVTAQVADLCPGCGAGSLDMSPAVFHALGGTDDQGVFPINWNFS
jgi:expansin (peptidoglycan-binding protein)